MSEKKSNIMKVEAPFGESRILLHCCCAPCSSAIVECLQNSGIEPVIFYCNPNIYPAEEYKIRKDECTRFVKTLGLQIVDSDYDHENWLACVSGMEKEPERGSRCLECFKLRLLRTAEYARRHGFRVISTTLASSRWKSLEQINAAGQWACEKVNSMDIDGPQVVWWDQNWRKGGLQNRRSELLRQYDFYNQQYCGCEFSIRKETLAIVIPAYRSRFLRQTLQSIASQDDKDFKVYIGDDASPEDLKSIVDEFESQLNITYVRFPVNMGTNDLTAHWMRCIALAKEDWIWLFSDDDTMDSNCVSAFRAMHKHSLDLFHFDVDVIDAQGNILERTAFPVKMSAEEFISQRMKKSLRSYVVEYIFRRSALEKMGGFVKFDLAWHSDDATWVALAQKRGINRIDGARVQWRRSGSNITSVKDKKIVKRKLDASLNYFSWLGQMSYSKPFTFAFYFVTTLYHFRDALDKTEVREYLSKFSEQEDFSFFAVRMMYLLKSCR